MIKHAYSTIKVRRRWSLAEAWATKVRLHKASRKVARTIRIPWTLRHGVRLSWPNPKDQRQAMISRPPLKDEVSCINLHMFAWSFFHRDTNLCHHLAGFGSCRSTQLVLQSPMPFNSCYLHIAEKDSLQYLDVAILLMRMVLVGDYPSAAAVLRALLALSFVHRNRLQSHATELRISATRALNAASVPKCGSGSMEAAQHIISTTNEIVFIVQIQIHRASCTCGQWATNLIGAKGIIKTSPLESSNESGTLIDSVYYHDMLSRFSTIHWHPMTAVFFVGSAWKAIPDQTLSRLYPITLFVYSTTLALLADVCDTVSTRSPDIVLTKDREDCQNFLKSLGFRIRNMPSPDIPLSDGFGQTTMNLLGPATETESRIHNALATFSQLSACERQFPQFILDCVARAEHERSTIPDLIARMEEQASSRPLYLLRKMIEAIWIQDDLALADRKKTNYKDKLSAVISSYLTAETAGLQ
ncbi:hypothetical protein BDW68DRAFT_195327 [Aspergillus falconensis]